MVRQVAAAQRQQEENVLRNDVEVSCATVDF